MEETKPIDNKSYYSDYIGLEKLLSNLSILTDIADEPLFIRTHQICELNLDLAIGCLRRMITGTSNG